jgi:hypothetical protein
LALHYYQSNSGLSDAFPDLSGPDAVRFAEWFAVYGETELNIDPAHLEPVRAELLEWGNAPAAEDREEEPWWPRLTNFALYLYRLRSDAQRLYPDVFGVGRWGFLKWLTGHAAELHLYAPLVEPLSRDIEARLSGSVPEGLTPPVVQELYLACSSGFRRQWTKDSFLFWLNHPAKVEGQAMYSAVHLSNLAYYIYRNREDLIAQFPDLTGPKRADYAEWFVRNGEREFGLGAAFLEPVHAGLIAWGNSRSPLDKMKFPWWPKLTNFALHLYASRPDAQAAYPDVLHDNRWNFLQWTVDNAENLNLYPDFAGAIREELKRVRRIRMVGRLVPGLGSRNRPVSTPATLPGGSPRIAE